MLMKLRLNVELSLSQYS